MLVLLNSRVAQWNLTPPALTDPYRVRPGFNAVLKNGNHLSARSDHNRTIDKTLNFRGESHDKGLPEDADVKASEGVLYSWEAFFV